MAIAIGVANLLKYVKRLMYSVCPTAFKAHEHDADVRARQQLTRMSRNLNILQRYWHS